MKAINAKDKNMERVFKALDLARERKTDREAIKHIYYDAEGKALVATNGKAMLVYYIKNEDADLLEAFGSNSGYYVLEGKCLIECKHEGAPFPTYQRVIPRLENMESAPIADASVQDLSSKARPYQTMAAAMLLSGRCLNMDYAPILAGLDLDTCYYWKGDSCGPMALAGNNLVFVIMPVMRF